MTRIVFLSFFLFFKLFSFAQTKEEVVQSVRDRYYRITGGKVDLENYSVGKYKVSAENGEVVIIKEKEQDGVFEYYFDSGKNIPYFIYFASKNNKMNPDLRVYLNNGDIVWYKENQDEVDNGFYDGPYHLILKAVNSYNTIRNASIKRDERVSEINNYVLKVNSMNKKQDTINYVSYSNEGSYEEWNVDFYYNKGEKLMSRRGNTGEHGSSEEIVYYDNGLKVFVASESSSWVGSYDNITVTKEYFFNGKLFWEENYRTYGESLPSNDNSDNPLWFNTDKVVPEIRVY